MAQIHHYDALHFLANRPLTPFSTVALRAVVTFVKWEERRRTRKALAQLDTHLLKDVGLTQETAHKEARLPFWMS